MSKNHKKKIEIPTYEIGEEFDFQNIANIVKAMDFLRIEAKNSGNREISMVISSAFNLCFMSYYMALRMQNSEEQS